MLGISTNDEIWIQTIDFDAKPNQSNASLRTSTCTLEIKDVHSTLEMEGKVELHGQ